MLSNCQADLKQDWTGGNEENEKFQTKMDNGRLRIGKILQPAVIIFIL
ncbi:MAG: hypothetical protein ACREFE_02755 [Limisphaerales bacterium]